MDIYLDRLKLPSERAKDILSKMSLEEKINQLCCYLLTNPHSEDIDVEVGSIATMNAGTDPKSISENIKNIQKRAIESSRFGIPIIFHTEALAGPIHPKCIGFPLSISNAASFNEENVHKMAEMTREQLKALGIRHALSPVLDIARDFRYGRIGETFGSDPTLVSKMGCAFIDGLQGKSINEGVAATAKHFLGCAQPEAGVNQTRAVVDERELEEVIAKPFEAAIRNSSPKAVMNSYGEINGEPFCSSEYYLKTLLREKLGFEGITTSDYHSIDRLIQPFKLVKNKTEAAAQALNGGMDMEYPSKTVYSELENALSQGLVSQEDIDSAVYRVLKLKFELGLFESPYPEFKKEVFECKQNEEFVSEATAETITLTKNTGILPVTDTAMKIGVIGEPANSLRHMYGAYTGPVTLEMLMNLAADKNAVGMAGVKLQDEPDSAEEVTLDRINETIKMQYPQAKTIFEALKAELPSVKYAKGFPVGNEEKIDSEEWKESERLAMESDLLIVCVGGKNGVGKKCTSGEGIDAAKIELSGEQEKAIQQLYALNPNMVVVHTDARPLVSRFTYDFVPGIIEAWLPCTYGGNAIAGVITGRYNPCGHLPVDIPKSTGQTPYYYSQRNGSSIESIHACTGDFIVNKDGYIDEARCAERPFGYGLSYTKFEYSSMSLEIDDKYNYEIRLIVKNTGDIDGADVVQLYGFDEYATVIRPSKELLGYARVYLKANEAAKVIFKGNLSQFAFEKRSGEFLIEKGEFLFEISKDSSTPVISKAYSLSQDIILERSKRVFYAESKVNYRR